MRIIFCFIISCSLFFTSCKYEKETETTEKWNDSTPMETVSIKDFSNKVQVLFKSDSGIFRSIGFGTPISSVKALEDSTTLVENGKNFVNYSLHIDSLEDADVLYFFDVDDKVNKIEIDIYPENEDSRGKLYQEIAEFFNKKYGEPSSEIEEVKIWSIPDKNLKIEMRRLGNAKVHDLQIDLKKIREDEGIQ